MEIKVKVKTNSKENLEVKEGIYFVSVKEPAEHGKANQAVIKLLTKHFKKSVKIVRGFTHKQKIVRIE